MEPKRIYRAVKKRCPTEEYTIPFGQAKIARQGKDITLIGWGAQHQQNMEAVQELEKEGMMWKC